MKDAAKFFKVLADESRLKILWLLFNHRELCVCDIMGALGITQSKASRHLSTLRHAGVVTDRREGLWSYYAIRPMESAIARAHLDQLKADLAKTPDAASVLAAVRALLEARNRGAACAGGGVRVTAERNTPSGRGRAHLSGGLR